MSPAHTTLRESLQATGIHRVGSPRDGFRYRGPGGTPVPLAVRQRIERLRIPPAWRRVVIARAPAARVQAIGLDAAGRWQYRYLEAHAARRSRAKFERLVAFARALPALRARMRRDLARPGMPRERACATALLLLTAAALRPGSEVYARENDTYGIATLRPRHVTVRGDRVTLAFRGKHGVRQRHPLRSRRLARLVREMLALSGRELLKYRDARGRLRDLRRIHLNAYVKQAMGARFCARDFRTWTATLVCAAALRRESHVPAGQRARAIGRAIAETARVLGNTAAVVRESYVHPAVVEAYRRGRVVACAIDGPLGLVDRMPMRLHPAERAVVRVIRATLTVGGD